MRKSASSSVDADARVRVREDRGRRLAAQVVDRVARVGQPPQRRRLLLDEAAHERAVLVERRPVARRMLLERERQLRAALDGERGEAEARAATRRDAVRAATPHASVTRARGLVSYLAGAGTSTPSGWRRPGPTSGSRVAAARARPARAAVHLLAGSRPAVDRRRASAPPPSRAHAGARPRRRRPGAATARARARHSVSAIHMFPMPATSVWSCSVSPNHRVAVGAAHAREHRVEVAAAREDVRPEPGERARVQLEHRPVPEHAFGARPAQYEPRPADARLAARPHRPAARSCAGASARRRRPRTAARGSCRAPRPTRAAGRRPARRRARPARAGAATRPRGARRPAPGGAAPRGEGCRPRAREPNGNEIRQTLVQELS